MSFWTHWVAYNALSDHAEKAEIDLEHIQADEPPLKIKPAWTGTRPFLVERKVLEGEDEMICSFSLVPEDGKALAPFLPGQFLTFELEMPGHSATGKAIVRCYSLSDAPNPDRYRISVKRSLAPPGTAFPIGLASNFFHDQVQVGSRLLVRAPAGYFFLDQGRTPVVLIAGGIGITPLLSMLNWSLSQQTGREICLFYGVRNEREVMMKSHLIALAETYPNFRLCFCFSDALIEGAVEAVGAGYQHRGRIDVDLLRVRLPLKPYHYYICGPSAMLESLVPALEAWGVPQGRIHFEAFGPASVRRNKSIVLTSEVSRNEMIESAITVNFTKSGKQLQWQPNAANLLDFAEANGVEVQSGCRAGSCGSCQVTIIAGEVAYIQTPDFDPEVGTCLLCVCRPKNAVSLEA
jgi:ferredoxin-NADP reductase